MSLFFARCAANMTQSEVATKIGVNPSTVSLWETGKTLPRASLLPKLADLYGCTVDELLKPGPVFKKGEHSNG